MRYGSHVSGRVSRLRFTTVNSVLHPGGWTPEAYQDQKNVALATTSFLGVATPAFAGVP
jgi:hypothetical protein